MAQALASKPGRAKAVSLSKVVEDRSRGSSRRNTAIITATVSAADAGEAGREAGRGEEAGLALLEHPHGAGPLPGPQVPPPVPRPPTPLHRPRPGVGRGPPRD